MVVFDPWLQLLAELMEKRAPFNGMRGKRGEEVGQEAPQVTSGGIYLQILKQIKNLHVTCSSNAKVAYDFIMAKAIDANNPSGEQHLKNLCIVTYRFCFKVPEQIYFHCTMCLTFNLKRCLKKH